MTNLTKNSTSYQEILKSVNDPTLGELNDLTFEDEYNGVVIKNRTFDDFPWTPRTQHSTTYTNL